MTTLFVSNRKNLTKNIFNLKYSHWIGSVLVSGVILLLWEVLALTLFAKHHVVPTPVSVVLKIWQDHFYSTDLQVTLSEAILGWVIGNTLAVVLAGLSLLLPKLESLFLSFGVMTYAVPTVAIGPLLFIIESPFDAKVTMSVLSVFFVTLASAVAGFRAASRTSLELISSFGGGKWAMLYKVRLRASIPSLVSGLSVSAPAAILGAMIGDYFGGQAGLGVVMLQAQQQLAVSRTWAVAVVATVVSGIFYALIVALAKVFGIGVAISTEADSVDPKDKKYPLPVSILFLVTKAIIGTILILLTWNLAVSLSGLSSFFVKTPIDIWNYLTLGSSAHLHQQVILQNLSITLYHAGSGWILGTVAAITGAIALILSPVLSKIIMPLILVLRSVPLVAMTPLIALIFGRGLVGVTMIAAMVTVVPSLVTISDGLKSSPGCALDVVSCAGGNHFQLLSKIRTMYALPALFTAAKISMPGAILGAVLAEWLVTGNGIGHAMAYDVTGSNFSNLWSCVTAIVVVSLVLYYLVNTMEKTIRSHLSVQ